MNPKISIIVPVYNVEKYLEKCLDSLVEQTYDNIEIIVVDDGSTDGSGKICDEYSTKYDNVKVLHQKNAGQSAARNVALDVAEGMYIMFVDSDDCIPKYSCEKMMQCGLQSEAEIVCGQVFCYRNDSECDNQVEWRTQEEIIDKYTALERLAIDYRWSVVWGKLYKRELWEQIRFTVGRLHEDEAVIYKIYYQCHRIVYTEGIVYFYRQNEASIMGRSFSLRRFDMFTALKERLDYYEENSENALFGYTIVEILQHLRAYYYLAKNAQFEKSILCEMRNGARRTWKKYKRAYCFSAWKYPHIYQFIYPCSYPLCLVIRVLKKIGNRG